MDSKLESKGYTRGKILKRAGIGAAAAWSVPFLASSASASVHPDAPVSKCSGSDPNTGLLSPLCEFQVCAHKNGLDCFCYPGAKGAGQSSGCCVCGGNDFCSNVTPCNTNGDCPKGYK